MRFEKVNEEIFSLVKDEPIYQNPSSTDLNKMARDFGTEVRIITSERSKNFYVFPSRHLHFEVCRMIPEFEEILKFIATPEQPSFIFTASGTIENGKITLHSSDILSWSKFDPDIRKQIKQRNWSYCNKYLNNDANKFIKHIKENK